MPPMMTAERFKAKLFIDGDCQVWRGCRNKYGYGQVGHKGKIVSAHRLAYFFRYGDIPDGLQVLHRCDNPSCCNPDHLFLGTHNDNMKDMVAKKRNKFFVGERHGMAILTESMVREIRDKCINHKLTKRAVAREYGVSDSCVSMLVRRVNWKHVM